MKCVHCVDSELVDYPDSQRQSLQCPNCKLIFNAEYIKDFYTPIEPLSDNVNKPPHYNNSNAVCSKCEHPIECIDVTRHLSFNIGNAIKYLWRYENKNGIEDLQKAIWYINDQITKLKGDKHE